jgi:hypothetical protein
MSHLILGQITDKETLGLKYLESISGEVIVHQTNLPETFLVEILDFESEEECKKRGKLLSLTQEEVMLDVNLGAEPYRTRILSALSEKYPTLK